MKTTAKQILYVTLENGTEDIIKVPKSFSKKDIVRCLHMKYGSQQWLAYSKKKIA